MYDAWGKRIIDMVLSGIAIVLLSPVFALTGLGILIEDGRPIVFKQSRPGRRGHPFVIYKFRSMAKDTADIPSGAIASPKITKVGRLVRRLNIDELPQLLNILLGDMSIVGPRPPLASQETLIRLRAQGPAWDARPGLTGLAQINSYDGMPDEAKARFDNQYAASVTLLGDLHIILRTVGYLRAPPPKY